MAPKAEVAHWLFATLLLLLGLLLLAETLVGTEVFRRRRWRAYAWPSVALFAGVMLWLVAVLSTFSTMHLLAHSIWAQVAMIAGGIQLAVARGKLSSPYWSLVTAFALLVSGASFIVHEQNGWLFSRSAFLHHALGWTLLVATAFPILQAVRPRFVAWRVGFALTFVVLAALLYTDRDVAPIFGHLSDLAGEQSR